MVLPVLLAACTHAPGTAPDQSVTLSLDIPNAALDPKGYTEVEITMHTPNGDLVRSATVGANGAFDLGDLSAMTGVWVEAALRNESGAAVGYGRTATAVDFAAGVTVTVPVRRPIVYVAGLVSKDLDGDPTTTTDIAWTATSSTFGDLSLGAPVDGSASVGTKAVLMVSAGPNLFMIEQAVSTTNGATPDPATKLTGPATIKPVSTGDHSIAAALKAALDGGVRDGAGSDDGKWLVIGTTLHLYVVDTTTGSAMSVADGDFGRVAMVNHGDGTASALALSNRGTPCNAGAKLVSVAFSGGGEVSPVVSAGVGGYADVASDANRAFAVDACKGQLVEITGATVKMLRDGLGKPTALAVSNGHAYIGVEKAAAPFGLSLVVASLTATDAPHTLWTEPSQQVATATDYPGVQREMSATAASFDHLEVGAGDDYVAMTSSAHFFAKRESALTFPELDLDTEELRVFDTSSGAVLQRYRSWCDGEIKIMGFSDVMNWACATTTGQSAPSNPAAEHHLGSMTFLFGKK